MNLFPYALLVALSFAFEALPSASILNLMQFSMQPSVEMMPCRIAFLFSDFVFHKSWKHANMSKSSMLNISFPSNFTASFFMVALPTLFTKVLFASTVEDNSMSKERFAVPGMMTSSLLKFITITDFGQSHWDYE